MTMKKILCVLAALAMLVAMVACNKGGSSGNDLSKGTKTTVSPPATVEMTKGDEVKNINDASVGDYVLFGKYEQDNNTSNGKEDIEWLVLANENDKLLIISKCGLDCQQYNEFYTSVTWEACSLRKWLNESFISNAFSSEEQNQIQNTTVTADKNPQYDISPGNDTTDKVFLLSITEVNKYFSSDDARKCVPTAYAIAQGAYTFHGRSYLLDGKATCVWWLRSPGAYSDHAAVVFGNGSVQRVGDYVSHAIYAVRPAMWINRGS